MVFENRIFIFGSNEESPLSALLNNAFSPQYFIRNIKTLDQLDDLLMGYVYGAMIVFDWDTVEDPYKTLINLRRSYYVCPIMVV